MSLLGLLACAAGASAQLTVQAVLLSHPVTNVGDVEATSVTVFCILPHSNRYQEVLGLKIHPGPQATHIDGEEQTVLAIPLGTIPPGQTRAVRVMAWVRPRPAKVSLVPQKDKVEPLAAENRQGHLADGSLLQLDKVRPIAEKAIGDKTRDVAKARALYDYMVEHCTYGVDDRQIPASELLTGRQPGSCTELAYSFVALCRSVDVPARVVSAYVNREALELSADWLSHSWAEFFAEGIGWVPVDPTNRINLGPEQFFGRQLGKYLTVLDDGVETPEGADPAWHVIRAVAAPENVRLEVRRRSVWALSLARTEEETFFAEAIAVLHDPDAAVRRDAIHEWARRRRPMREAYWLEALLDADSAVRLAAAEELGKSGRFSILLAVMHEARRETDADVQSALLAAARQILRNDDDELRAEAVKELAKSRTDEALKLVDGMWDDESLAVRKAVANMLFKFGDLPKVHEGYRRLAKDDDDFVRIAAALRWSRVGTHEALKNLATHLESKYRWDREEALKVLKKRTSDDFGFDPTTVPTTRRNKEAIKKWQDWLDAHPEAK